ncbi:MAG: sensor histidine kinase [Bacteroidota bacterium]
MKLLFHALGWGVLLLLVLLQNDLSDWNDEDYFLFAVVLVCMGMVVYINLYLLIPRFLFTKKYAHYTGFLFLLVFLTASLITWIISDLDLESIDWSSRFVVTLIAMVSLALLTSGGKLFVEYLRKMMKFREIENKQLKDELTLLKAQIQPHFLLNTLNNLYGLITQHQNQKASEITLKLSDLMRYLLESSKADKVSLKKEIQFLEDYLSLEKIRLSKNTDIRFEVSGIVSDVLIAPLLFIPLVENAFKHGLKTNKSDSFAHFSLSVQGKDLFFEAKNSLGKSLENSPESGTGIANLRKRLQLIYPNNHLLDIQESNDEYKVVLHIQL